MARSHIRNVSAAPGFPAVSAAFPSISAVSAAVSVCVGLLVLLGWVLNITVLKSVVSGYVSMKPNQALSFVALGAALWLFSAAGMARSSRRMAGLLAAMVTVLALLTLSEYTFGWNLGIDQALFSDSPGTPLPGRMSQAGALDLLLLSGSLLLLMRAGHAEVLAAQGLAFLATLLASLGILGYAYGVNYLVRITPSSRIALHAVVTLLLLGIGLLALTSGRGIMVYLGSASPGGLLVRRMLPLAIGVPSLSGWIIVAGYDHGWIHIRMALAVLVIAVVLAFGYGLFLSAGAIDRMSEERIQSEAREREAVIRAEAAEAVRARDEQLLAERTATLEDVTHRVMHDALTDLPNRTLFYDRMQQAIQAAGRGGACFALLFVDLDGFKRVNDTLGHHIGDLLLPEIATRMRSAVRASDTVARLGGDEFAVLLPSAVRAGAERAAAMILVALSAPVVLEGHRIEISCSIGIALFPSDGGTAETLMQRADVAMYVAKRNRMGYAIYSRGVG